MLKVCSLASYSDNICYLLLVEDLSNKYFVQKIILCTIKELILIYLNYIK